MARHTSDTVSTCFLRESTALRALAGCAASGGPIPMLLGHGWRAGLNKWPVLLLTPQCMALSDWVGRKCKDAAAGGGEGGSATAASAASAAAAAVRLRCATSVALDVLEALQAAHDAGFIHCDVRPSNIVVRESGKAVLIAWGLSRAAGAESRGCGVAAFADERVFSASSYSARPEQDLCALLYTWLSAAHSATCVAPWLAEADEERGVR